MLLNVQAHLYLHAVEMELHTGGKLHVLVLVPATEPEGVYLEKALKKAYPSSYKSHRHIGICSHNDKEDSVFTIPTKLIQVLPKDPINHR